MTGVDSDELTPQRLREIEGRWKSDVDAKLDRLCRFADRYQAYLELCIDNESERKKLRHAVMEKTLIGLAWGGVVFIGLAIWHYVRAALK